MAKRLVALTALGWMVSCGGRVEPSCGDGCDSPDADPNGAQPSGGDGSAQVASGGTSYGTGGLVDDSSDPPTTLEEADSRLMARLEVE
jgi:hypothetical protein